MILRMFLYLIEEFHLALAKEIPGLTISIGGEEKKAKIIQNICNTALDGKMALNIVQATEDATKWNECLAPAAFALMHRYMFDDSLRVKNMIPIATPLGKLFSRIAVTGNFFMAIKKVQLGQGVTATGNNSYKRITWSDTAENMMRMNTKTQGWFKKIIPLLTKDKEFIRASPGMLMGMMNAASSTLGIIPTNHRMNNQHRKVISMRSSDDSMSIFLAKTPGENAACVECNKRNLEMIGINLSTSKTLFFKEGFGEYTSWYMVHGT